MAEALNGSSPGDLEALLRLKSAEPFQFLNPDSDFSNSARCGSRYLFSSLAPLCPKSPFDRLLLDGFDAEQIWQQIDVQTQHLIPSLLRKLNHFKRNPKQISTFLSGPKVEGRKSGEGEAGDEKERDDSEDVENLEVSDEEGDEDEEEREDEDDDEEDDEEEEEGDGVRDVEDQFLKIRELERYLEKDERKEYGEEDEENHEDDEEDDADEVDEDEDVSGGDADDIRYEDFFGSKEKGKAMKKGQHDKLHDLDANDEDIDHNLDIQSEKISTHEKQLEKMRLKIEQMEKANLEPKTWTMQGEVTAAKRPKNSALEVDLDFEHNVRPAPIITKEVTESLEDLIQKRIIEGHFDDVQKPPRLPSTAPKVLKVLDENKSKKGLATIYEEEYAQKTGLASAPLLYTDEQKKEASLLFRKLCLKLDALSHFHFAPKPVIEDMSIQSNIPALAMEEIVPLAVSDAAMLAPEEVFSGKADIKEDAELTHEERKRRRANKKRKLKGVCQVNSFVT